MLADMIAANTSARPLPDDRLTTGKWLNIWLRRQRERDDLRPNTVDAYDRSVRLLLPAVGFVPLRRLRSQQVADALRDLRRQYTAHTVAGARAVLSTAVKDAMRAGHVMTNEAALAKAPKVPRRGLPAPDTATVRALLAELAPHRLSALYVLLAGTGLRIGEATGLRWEDLSDGRQGPQELDRTSASAVVSDRGKWAVLRTSDGTRGLAQRADDGLAERRRHAGALGGDRPSADAGADALALSQGDGVRDGRSPSLTVRYQLQRINGEHVLTDPKTDTAGRVIHLPPTVQEALRAHRVRQAAERLASGRQWRHTGLVFTTADGEPVSEQTAHWTLARACERAGTRHVSNHDLRRWALTEVESRLGREAAQRMGGHANPHETQRYITENDRMLSQVASVLEEALG